MTLNVKVGLIGLLDMLKFANLAKTRKQAIDAAPAKEIKAEYPINNKARHMHPDYQTLLIADIIEHKGAEAKSYIFRRKDGAPYTFRAGQYLSLKLPIGNSFVTRPYSIASSPQWALEGKMAITVKKNPNGFAADHILDTFKIGDEVIASGAEGHFYYEGIRDCKQVVALAGGSGITPFLSMAYAIRDGIEDFDLTILFGSRTEQSILFKEEFETICAQCPRVKVIHVLSDEEKEGYEHGFITAELIKKYAGDEPYSIFICGPEAMYRFVDGEVAKLGLEQKYIRRELQGVTKKVWEQPGYPMEMKCRTFTVTVKQGAVEYKIPAAGDEPLLVAFERAGIKAPSRCRSGECGWCRSHLVKGDVYIPEETDGRRWADKKYNEIHPCATFPLSDLTVEVPGEYY